MEKDIQRFLDYVQIDTQSDDLSFSVPSTAKQLNLSRKLQEDLKELGIDDINEELIYTNNYDTFKDIIK